MAKKIGPRFHRELVAAGLDQVIASWREGGNDTDIELKDITPAQKAALDALIAAHDGNAPDVRQKTIAGIFESLTAAEINTLNGLAAFRKNLWTMLARGSQPVPEDNAKIAAMCSAIGTTPQELFSR